MATVVTPPWLCSGTGALEQGLTIGGKAKGLLILERHGLRTPPWHVIPTECARQQPWQQPEAASVWLHLFESWKHAPFQGVAVRSSAPGEDTRKMSAAGLYHTDFVKSPSEVAEACARVYASALRESVRVYHNDPAVQGKGSMAIILQPWVKAVCSGVIFSAHPLQAHPNWMFIEVVGGQGTQLVSGAVTPASFYIHAENSALLSETSPNIILPEDALQRIAAELRAALLRLEQDQSCPLDVEWAYDGEQVWFLQVRAVTHLRPDAAILPKHCATSWFFDQRFIEPIRPITRTTLIPLIVEISVKDALEMRSRDVPEPLVYFYAGQCYVAHRAYRRMLGGVPHWFLSPDLRALFPDACFCEPAEKETLSLFHYLVTASCSLYRHFTEVFLNIRAWDNFVEKLPRRLRDREGASIEDRAAWLRQWQKLDELTAELLRLHRWSILWADYFFWILHGIARHLPRFLREPLSNALTHDLNLITVHANDALQTLLQRQEQKASGNTHAVESACMEFEIFADRSGSLDYAVPTWGELYGSSADDGIARVQRNQISFPTPRTQNGKGSPSSLLAKLLYVPRRFLELREEQRFYWEKILARQRYMLLDAADRLVNQGILSNPEDVWFLEWNELVSALFDDGRVEPALLVQRKHAWVIENGLERPLFIGPQRQRIHSGGGILRGIAAAPGQARGKAHKIHHIAETMRIEAANCVLVVRALDPAMTPCLRQVAGIVAERGGILSHGAILAREYGVPMVAGIENLFERVEEGQWVTIDGDRGVVVLEEE
jgi:pyruvate,water dikinase